MESSHAHSPLVGNRSTSPVRFAGVDALPLSGDRLEGARTGILLAHGFGQTRHSWAATQQRLADEGHGSFAWDARGHGQSGRNAPGCLYSEAQFVGDQLAAAAQLPGRAVLVGASMGGLCGLLAQARHRVYSALVLVDVTPRWEAAGMQRIHEFMTAFPDGFESFDQAAAVIADYLPQRRSRKTPAQLSSLLHQGAGDRLRWHWDPRLLAEFVQGSEHLQETISQAARRLDVPVLLISGGRSDLVSNDTVAHFLELVPHAHHVRLEHATHMLAGDDNDAFIDSLLDFLRAQFPEASPVPCRSATAATCPTPGAAP